MKQREFTADFKREAPFLMPVRLRKPVEMEAVDDAPVDLVFLSLFPAKDQSSSLKLMSAVARRLRQADIAKTLREAEDTETVFDALTRPEIPDPIHGN